MKIDSNISIIFQKAPLPGKIYLKGLSAGSADVPDLFSFELETGEARNQGE
jgi:hypothetical protein